MTSFNRPQVSNRKGFANPKPPNWGGGLDWNRINDDRLRRLDLEIACAGGAFTPEHKFHLMSPQEKAIELAKPPKTMTSHNERLAKARSERSSNGGRKSRLMHDPEELAEMYETLPPRKISEETGINYNTVIKYLKIAGVWDPNKYRGWEHTTRMDGDN